MIVILCIILTGCGAGATLSTVSKGCCSPPPKCWEIQVTTLSGAGLDLAVATAFLWVGDSSNEPEANISTVSMSVLTLSAVIGIVAALRCRD